MAVETKTWARCAHFGDCGGCRLQDSSYPEQLAKKTAFVGSLLEPLGWSAPVPVRPSPQRWYYRNKMEFSFQDVYPAPAPGEDHLLLGLKRRKRWDKVMNLNECHLLSEETPALLASVHAWARRERLDPYNLHRQVGFLRHLVVREAKAAPDRMVLLVTGPGELPEGSFVEAVRSAYPATTVLWGVNGGSADVARSDRARTLDGPGTITEILLGRKFRISPYTFFQTNSLGAADLYSRIRSWLQELRPRNLIDLYCGSGGISLCVADLCERVLGVEMVASAVEDARHNAAANSIANAEFLEATVEALLPSLAQHLDADTVVLDPPRSGLHPRAVQALKDLAPRRILYVSCNPKAFAEDARRLGDCYLLRRVEAVDLFPHTDHLETLALLEAVYSVIP